MIYNPLLDNLTQLTDQQLDQALTDLTRKYVASQSIGNYNLQFQLQMMIEVYRNAIVERTMNKQSKLAASKNPNEPDPFSVIDIS